MTSLDETYEALERARTTAILLECQVAAATAIHAPLDLGIGTDNCRTVCTECGTAYPCLTASALGATVLDDDLEVPA